MRQITPREFLEEHIPYRLAHLEACLFALLLIHKQMSKKDIHVACANATLLTGQCSMLTNAWVETGLIACRAVSDFLCGDKGKKHRDATIEMFKRADGSTLQRLTLEDVIRVGPKDVTPKYLEISLKRTRILANRGVAHMQHSDIRAKHDPCFVRFACRTLHEAVLVYIYDELKEPRPKPAIVSEVVGDINSAH